MFQMLHLKYLLCLSLFTLVVNFNDPSAYSVFTSKMQSRQMGVSGKNMTKSTSISGDMCSLEKNDGSQSDTAVGASGTSGKKRRSSIGAKMVAIVGLSRKSRSASQLSQTGRHFYATFDFVFESWLKYVFFSLTHFVTVICGWWQVPERKGHFKSTFLKTFEVTLFFSDEWTCFKVNLCRCFWNVFGVFPPQGGAQLWVPWLPAAGPS